MTYQDATIYMLVFYIYINKKSRCGVKRRSMMRSCQALGKQSNRCQFVVWLGLYIVKERVQCLRPFTQSLPSCRSSLSSLHQHLGWPYDLPLLTPSFSLALPCPARLCQNHKTINLFFFSPLHG